MLTRPPYRVLFALSIAAAAAVPPAAFADPPPWAPAHGWRKKHDPYYVGYSGRKWDDDYGIISGRCNREAIGVVIGAVAGGAIGSQVGKGSGKTVATILGSVSGAVIGAHIGREMDQTDRACFGHALELAKDNQTVSWINPDTGMKYFLTPVRGYSANGRPCREFKTRIVVNGRSERGRGKACQAGDGTWQIL